MTKLCPLLSLFIYLQSILDNMSVPLCKFYTNGWIFFKLYSNFHPNGAMCKTHLTLLPALSRTLVGYESHSAIVLVHKLETHVCMNFLWPIIITHKSLFWLLQTSNGNFNASEILRKLDVITTRSVIQTGDLISVSSILDHVVQGINISDKSTNTTHVTDVCGKYFLV